MPSDIFLCYFVLGCAGGVVALGWMLITHFDNGIGNDRPWREMPWRWLALWFTAWFWLPWVGYGLWALPWHHIARIMPPSESSRVITSFDPNGGPPKPRVRKLPTVEAVEAPDARR